MNYPNKILLRRRVPAGYPVLWLPLWKLDGAQFTSKDAYGRLVTVTGAPWGPQGRPFDGVDDKFSIPDFYILFADCYNIFKF